MEPAMKLRRWMFSRPTSSDFMLEDEIECPSNRASQRGAEDHPCELWGSEFGSCKPSLLEVYRSNDWHEHLRNRYLALRIKFRVNNVPMVRLGYSRSRCPEIVQLFVWRVKASHQSQVRANCSFTRSVQIDWKTAECGSWRFVHAVETASRLRYSGWSWRSSHMFLDTYNQLHGNLEVTTSANLCGMLSATSQFWGGWGTTHSGAIV